MLSRIGTNSRGNTNAAGRLGDGSRIAAATTDWWLSGGILPASVAGVVEESYGGTFIITADTVRAVE